jgi:glucose-1-phosphate adenylyltransferase
MRKTIALLLAGGVGSRLSVLAQVRAKPAVTFGGIYRIIDFTLSNVSNSGIENVGILTQYKPFSLMKHIETGSHWDFIGRSRSVKILPPKTGQRDSDWYRGTADAVYQNYEFVDRFHSERVIILSGDHIYHMDYTELINFHKEKNAELTIATRVVPIETASEFGIAEVDRESKIINWEEKPEKPRSNLASMGIYVFNTKFLKHCLEKVNGFDFGKHVIPWVLKNYTAYAFPFYDYWQDVGTIKAYWDTNMDLLNPKSGLNLERWKIYTNVTEEAAQGDRPPAYFAGTSNVTNSIISPDCQIAGTVINSILSPGVIVVAGAQVENSVIMHDTRIEKNARVDQAIIDKNCTIGEGCLIGHGDDFRENQMFPKYLNTGIVLIGKNATIKSGVKLGRNSLVFTSVCPADFKIQDYPAGSSIETTPN